MNIAVFILAGLLLCAAANAGQSAPKGSSGIETIGDARFTVITPNLIRIERAENGALIDDPSLFAADRSARFTGYKAARTDNSITIDTGVIKLTYKNDGKPFGADNLQVQIKKGKSSVEWKPGMPSSENLGGTERTLDGWDGAQHLSDGLISRQGWFLLDDSKTHLYTKDWVKPRPAGSGTDWYLFGYGSDYKAALKSLTAIGGAVPMPRKYALGTWYSRYWAYTSDDFRKIVAEYSEHGFPLDVMVMDMDWHVTDIPGVNRRAWANMIWTGYTWDRKLLPDAEELIKWFHKQGLAVTLNDHPADGVQFFEECYPEFTKAMGKDPAAKEEIPFDAGDKKYMDTFWKYTHQDKLNAGIDFWWLDWQQYPDTRSIPGLQNLVWLNNYYYKMTASGGKRGMSFSRWAGWGDHKHPIHFSGDSHTTWRMLAAEVPFTSTAGNVGCFFWSHDIGGHMGGRNEESYTRWCQFGATTAALRSHSTRDAALDRRPWTYPKWAEDSMRLSFHLRSELFPYIYSSVRQSCKDSVPLNRPMYMEYPEDERAYKNGQQYFLGDNLIAAPITMPGIGPDKVGWQAVWLPKGLWYDCFSGVRYKGDREILSAADINEFPLFARGGVPIPMQPYTQRMTTAPLDKLVIRCYPGEDGKTGTYTLYEDDGISQGYTEGEFATTELSYHRKGSEITVKIAPRAGSFKGIKPKRSYVIELPGVASPESVKINGKPATADYVADQSEAKINVPEMSAGKECVVVVTAKSADFDAIRVKAIAKRAGLKNIPSGAKDVYSLLKTIDPSGFTPEQKTLLMAACGVGMVARNQHPYLFPAETVNMFYYAPEAFDGDKVALWWPSEDSFALAEESEYPAKVSDIVGEKSQRFEAKITMPGGEITLKPVNLQGD